LSSSTVARFPFVILMRPNPIPDLSGTASLCTVDDQLALAAVRSLAYEVSDCGLPSPDLTAGIRRVKGAKRLGIRVGNWLSAEQGRTLISASAGLQLREVRNRAVLGMLIGWGLR
jgi:hypothetical protein